MRTVPSTFIAVLFLYVRTTQCFAYLNLRIQNRIGLQETRSSLSVAHHVNGERVHEDHDTASSPIPKHVGFVCDGNSRWARQRGLPVIAGHAAGADCLVDVVLPHLKEIGVKYCTMYGFSTENWKRSEKEISDIFKVMEHTAEAVYERLLQPGEQIRIRIVGDLDDERIPNSLKVVLDRLQTETARLCCDDDDDDKEAKHHTLCLAINYGGRRDILEAAKKLAHAAVATGDVDGIDNLSEEDFSKLLSTNGVPDPDLVIRTSGECRLSNFLLWNAAYSELYFTDTLWPDFNRKALSEALEWYASRKRRFGARQKSSKIERS